MPVFRPAIEEMARKHLSVYLRSWVQGGTVYFGVCECTFEDPGRSLSSLRPREPARIHALPLWSAGIQRSAQGEAVPHQGPQPAFST